MKLCIISVEKGQYEIKRIVEEAEKLGIKTTVASPAEITKNDLKDFSHILFRAISSSSAEAKKLAADALSLHLKIVDEKIALGKARNKYQNYMLFKENKLFVPATILLSEIKEKGFQDFEGEEIVVKDIRGKRGIDVHKCMKSELPTLIPKLNAKKDYMLQEFVKIEKEFRVFVVGKKVLGAIEKKSDSWLKNIFQGAKAKKAKLNAELKAAVLIAVKSVGTEIAGVDAAITSKGIFILEVNRSPGFQAFEQSTGINVAGEILSYLQSK